MADTRSITRTDQTGGPEYISSEDVAPLFPQGLLSQVSGSLESGERGNLFQEVGEWVTNNPDDPHLDYAIFLWGYIAHLSENDALAVRLLAPLPERLPLLSDYCYYYAALSSFRMERFEDALTFSASVSPEAVYGPRSLFLSGKSLYQLGSFRASESVLGEFAEAYPNAYYIAQVELELARVWIALSSHIQAAEQLSRVASRYPGSQEEEVASELLDELLPSLPREARDRFSSVDDANLVARAEALFSRHRSREVIDLLDESLERLDVNTSMGCLATFLVGKSYTKLREHSNALPFYESINASSCVETDLKVKALYLSGQALWNLDRDAESIVQFRRLYTEYPDHSYADDAMLYVARIERSNNEETRYLAMLEEQIQRYPDGDMLGDANWLLFEHYYRGGNYTGAVSFASAITEQTGESGIYNRGRISYFRANALALLGDRTSAALGYMDVIQSVPLSYYALLSFERLRSIDPQNHDNLVRQLRSSSDHFGDQFLIELPEVTHHPAFEQGILLLRLGLFDLARKEFSRLEDHFPNHDSVLWLVSFLFDSAGAYHISHDIPRRGIADFLTGYPTAEDRDHYMLAYPRPFQETVVSEAEARDLDPYLVYAIMREESGFNPQIESWANARGLMQLMMGTAENMAERVNMRRVRSRDLFEPDISIRLGSEYLGLLSDRYDNNLMLLIPGYNAGEGNVDRFIGNNGHLPMDQFAEEIPFKQTRNYVKRVLMTLWIYRWLYEPEAPFPPLDLRPAGAR